MEAFSRQPEIHVAVVGVGRMGRHHVRTYRRLPDVRLVAVVDRDRERAEEVADEYGCHAYTDIDQLLTSHPQLGAVTVAVPTVMHAAVAEPLLQRRIACLVEKPLAGTQKQAKALAKKAARAGAMLQVGHTERFNPAVQAVAAMGLTPRFIEVHRVSPMTFRSLDVGVVMDMMIHDLDIVLMLAKSRLKRVDATGVAVLGEHEDIANARLVFASGCVATITASRLAFKTERRMRLFNEDAYVNLDYQRRTGLVVRKSDNAEALDEVRHQIAEGADLSDLDYSQLVNVEELDMNHRHGDASDDPLTAELTSFLAAVRNEQPPEVDGQAGYAAVQAAERVIDAIQGHRWEGLAKKAPLQSALSGD